MPVRVEHRPAGLDVQVVDLQFPGQGGGWSAAAEHRRAGLLVAAQAGLLATHLLLPRGSDWPLTPWTRAGSGAAQTLGLGLAGWVGASLGVGLTASPLPNQRTALRVDGPFGLVRHPVYTGLLLAVGGRAADSGQRRQLVVLGLLLALFNVKARVEERALIGRFPQYSCYMATVPRLVPPLSGIAGLARRGRG